MNSTRNKGLRPWAGSQGINNRDVHTSSVLMAIFASILSGLSLHPFLDRCLYYSNTNEINTKDVFKHKALAPPSHIEKVICWNKTQKASLSGVFVTAKKSVKRLAFRCGWKVALHPSGSPLPLLGLELMLPSSLGEELPDVISHRLAFYQSPKVPKPPT